MTIRAFIALEIPAAALEKIIQIKNDNYNGYENVRWEPAEKLHITLKFLGDTEEKLIEKILGKLSTAVSSYNSLMLSFNEFGIFKREGKPKIFWVGLKPDDELKTLALDIENLCLESGFQKEKREFKPHITLLRVKGNEDFNALQNLSRLKFEPVNFSAEKITFYKSELKKSGSVYTELKSFYLKQGEGNGN
ncbi:MAG: RNA 2',3'-cyclic phosphodiesterase [Ignavibacteriales bacterium]|nr:RNA 2',3'-cyclic phosphodiesterase [Ignavibacteriales bacterium]